MSSRQLTIIIIILGVLVAASWGFIFFSPKIQVAEGNLFNTNQQASILEKKLQELLTGNQNSKLKNFQKTLRSFVQLPLPLREGGRDNPFLLITEQLNQFSKPASPTGAKVNTPKSTIK